MDSSQRGLPLQRKYINPDRFFFFYPLKAAPPRRNGDLSRLPFFPLLSHGYSLQSRPVLSDAPWVYWVSLLCCDFPFEPLAASMIWFISKKKYAVRNSKMCFKICLLIPPFESVGARDLPTSYSKWRCFVLCLSVSPSPCFSLKTLGGKKTRFRTYLVALFPLIIKTKLKKIHNKWLC